ncbi:helix-turn-helix domain-containing protein [Cellulomonas soli]|uniref:helix-turn-helix domain-containing protein n=1 Tax=Cellulomonas soli TaxID=931535 RepID=UPI003F84DA4D
MTHANYPPALLRREDAAEYLAISPRKLDDLQARGLVIPVDFDGMKRFRRQDLDDMAQRLPDWGV